MRNLTILSLSAALSAQPASSQTRTPSLWEVTGNLNAAGVVESSGVAVSRQYPGILWTHNDSGERNRIFAVRESGELVAEFLVAGARNVDWEDIESAPCPWRLTEHCLYIADTGDNAERRVRVILYVIPEPNPFAPATDSVRTTAPAHALRIRYDRPRDAEALLVGPDGTVSIVTKGRTGPFVRFEIPREVVLGDSVALAPVDTIDFVPQRMLGRWITAGAMRPDGRYAVLRTYTELYFYRIQSGRWIREGAQCWIGPREPQGEGIDWLDDNVLILTSERTAAGPAQITRVSCP